MANQFEELIAESAQRAKEGGAEYAALQKDQALTDSLDVDALAERIGVDPARVSATVRGDAIVGRFITFVVVDEDDGTTSRGWLRYEDLAGDSSSSSSPRSRSRSRSRRSTASEPAPASPSAPEPTGSTESGDGGTAADSGSSDPESGTTSEGSGSTAQVPEGVPADYAELNAEQVAQHLVAPPEGVDPAALWAYEKAQHEKPRVAVERAAKRAGLD